MENVKYKRRFVEDVDNYELSKTCEVNELDKYQKEKITLTFTRQEWSDIANVFTTADYAEISFLKIKDKKLRKLFEDSLKRRHKLWIKIVNL